MTDDRLTYTAQRILSAIARSPLGSLSDIPDCGPATGETLDRLELFGLVLLQASHWSLTAEGAKEFQRHLVAQVTAHEQS